MSFLWFCLALLTTQPAGPDFTRDPLFRLPTEPRTADVSEWTRLLNSHFEHEANAVIFRSPDLIDEIREKLSGTLPYGELFFLEAWGASGDPKAVPRLMQWYGKVAEPLWAYSILAGLARSMDPVAHRFIMEKLQFIEMNQLPVRVGNLRIEPAKLVVFMAAADPLALAPLLADARTSSWVAEILLKAPHPGQVAAWLSAAQAQRLELYKFLSYLELVFFALEGRDRDRVCDFLWKQLPVGSSATDVQVVQLLSQCPGVGTDPRWVALLGRDPVNLLLLKAVRDQSQVRIDGAGRKPLLALMKEYAGQPGWERILLDVLGQVQDEQTVKTVASYVLHNNLWLREQALSALSLGAHPLAGNMLHAAALENAGEEAIAYFLPYLHHTRGLAAHAQTRATLTAVAARYLQSSEPAYQRAAVLALALAPESGTESQWWPIAKKIADDLILRKDWDQLGGFLPVLARASKSAKYLEYALDHTHPSVVLGATLALGLNPRKEFTPRLLRLARHSRKAVAVNAAFALSRTPDTLRENLELVNHPQPEVAAHAVLGLRSMGSNPMACAALLDQMRSARHTVSSMQNIASGVLGSCGPAIRVRGLRLLAVLPPTMAELLLKTVWVRRDRGHDLAPFFMRLINLQHLGVVGKKFQFTLPGQVTVQGFSTFGGIVFIPGLTRETVKLEWIQ
ncbi:hypothetical protein KKC22_16610 [Myxococcota bacterium]|nr:hypothetical protein [Myxococcota bacterium]